MKTLKNYEELCILNSRELKKLLIQNKYLCERTKRNKLRLQEYCVLISKAIIERSRSKHPRRTYKIRNCSGIIEGKVCRAPFQPTNNREKLCPVCNAKKIMGETIKIYNPKAGRIIPPGMTGEELMRLKMSEGI